MDQISGPVPAERKANTLHYTSTQHFTSRPQAIHHHFFPRHLTDPLLTPETNYLQSQD